ncbi:sugar-binding protein [Acholeplasma granularum]|uniref:sugar-binding protein n=1 Tax=Acholeplasma granularum TaxID=264635 RepID=UPI0004709D68|nr:sugar-binding protein [Acholeplasma granularum]
MKKIINLFILGLVLILIACQPTKYSFENPIYPEDIDFNSSELDENISLDGKLDEAFYNDLEDLSFTSAQNPNQSMSIKAYFANKGLLVGIFRNDKSVYSDESIQVFRNDSVELYINPTNNKQSLTKDYVQLRISATNLKESWIGTPSPDGYPWSYYFVPFMSEVYVDGQIIDSYENDIEDNRKSNGYSIEVFISWETLGLTSKPDTIDLFPAFVDKTGLGVNEFKWNGYGTAHNNPSGYVTFNHQKPGTESGSIFGDSNFGMYATTGFDVKNDNILVQQNGGYDQYTFFKNVHGSKYGFSVEISDLNILNGDQYPKVGVIVGQNESELLVFLLDPFVNFDNFYGVLVPRNKVNGEWGQWGWNDGIPLPIGFNYQSKNKISVVRDETFVYIFVNDEFIVKREHNFTEDTQAGLFTMNMTARYTNATAFNETVIDNLITLSETPENDTFMQPTPGFKIEENSAIQNGGYDQWVYLKEVQGSVYGFSVNISDLIILNNDQFPKVGIVVGKDSNRILNYFLDPFPGFNNYYGLIVEGALKGSAWTDWQWPDGVNLPVGFSYHDNNKITLLKDETNVYILVNDVFVQKQAHGFTNDTQAGLFTMNMHANYTNIEVFDTASVQAQIESIESNSSNLYENITAGFDVTDETNVKQNGLGVQSLYFKDMIGNAFMATTYITIGSNLDNDQTPKIGMVTRNDNGGQIAYLLDPHAAKDWKDVVIVRKPSGSDYNWPGTQIWLDELDYNNEIKLTVVRSLNTLYYFVDDVLIHIGTTLNSLDSQPGLMTMAHTGTFKNSYATIDQLEIDAYLDNYIFNATDNFGWEGTGNFNVVSQTEVTMNPNPYQVNEPNNLIVNKDIELTGDFSIEFDISNVTYVDKAAPGIEVWPKLSFLLIQSDNTKNYVSFGAALDKQNRIETFFDTWVNWQEFTNVDWQTGFNIKIIRTILNNQATIQIYVNDVLIQIDSETSSITTDYIGTYTIGLTFNHASGQISNMIHT